MEKARLVNLETRKIHLSRYFYQTPPPSAPPLDRGGLNNNFYNLHYQIAYLKHLLTASNQHGVHSPFVYDFVTKCLYAKPKIKESKREGVLLKSIPYFSVEKLKLDSVDDDIANQIEERFYLKSGEEHPFDLIYLETPDSEVISKYKETIHNDSMILLGNIHRNINSTAIWEALTKDKLVTVSIDMFYCGALFIRKEQRKEHFKIRI